MAKKVIGEYLYALKPYVDTNAWRKASGSAEKMLKEGLVSQTDYTKQVAKQNKLLEQRQQLLRKITELEIISKGGGERSGLAKKMLGEKIESEGKTIGLSGLYKEADDLASILETTSFETEVMGKMVNTTGMGFAKFAGGLTKATGSVMTFIGVLQAAVEKTMEIVNKAADTSSRFHSTGAFGSMETRTTMSRYGVSATRAVAMTDVLNQMGLSPEDFGRMNKAQRETYDELIGYYESGIDRIDVDKLKDYHQTMDDFQIAQAKWKIGLQNAVLKIFAESDSLKNLTGSLEKFFDSTIKFLEAPAVQWFFDTFIAFLGELVDVASWLLDKVGWLLGGSSGSKTTNNNATNTYYIYGGNNSSESIARSISQKQAGGVS